MTGSAALSPAAPLAASSYPAIRESALVPDSLDTQRIALVRDRWSAQDAVRLPYERQVEEHCRLLAGRQWDTWSDTLGRFVDVSSLLSEEDKAWRQRPVVNFLAYWYQLTHARMTENPPILTFQPATADRADAMLAQTLDTVFKTCWADAHMSEAMDRLMGWVVAAGTGFLKSYPDDTKGQESPRVGPAQVVLPHPETGEPMPPIDLDEQVPFSKDGVPQFEVQHDPETNDYHAVPTADVEYEKDGQICVAVLNPVQVRGEWNNKPWHDKAWHIHRDYYTVDEIQGHWGVTVAADTMVGDGGSGPGYLERLLFGGGYYGTAERGGNAALFGSSAGTNSQTPGYACVDEYWEKPSELNEHKGRHLVVTSSSVIYDGPNPFPKLAGPSPIRCFQFVGMPGRPNGTTPLEFLVPLQRQMNRFWAQGMEHASLMTNPAILIDDTSGIEDEDLTMTPGMTVFGGMRNGQQMLSAFVPPPLSQDFWKLQEMVKDTLMFLGNITGTEGSSPTDNASGELVSQLRANSDRFVGPTARQMVTEIARMADDWTAILSVLWTRPKLILYAGDDNVPQTIAVEPEMWSGNANAIPDVASMLPESRQAKQGRVMAAFTAGVFGNPALDPKAAETVRTMLQFPDLNRAMQPGGVDAVTANQALGKILLGDDPATIQLLEPYKLPVWLETIGNYICTPEYLVNTPEIQAGVMQLFQNIKTASMQQVVEQQQEQAGVQAAALNAAAQVNPMVAAQAHGQMQQHLTPPGGDKGAAGKAAPAGPAHPGPATPADVRPPQSPAPPTAPA